MVIRRTGLHGVLIAQNGSGSQRSFVGTPASQGRIAVAVQVYDDALCYLIIMVS